MELTPYATQPFARGELPGITVEPDIRFSFPVPVMRRDRLLEAVFLFAPLRPGFTRAPRPHAWVLLSAESGELEMYSRCDTMDFIPPGQEGEAEVSLTLPKRLSPKKYEALSKELLARYEELRTFVFHEDLNRDEVKTVVAYKELFLRLAYEGHYPYYHALSPEFFGWLRLPLPKLKGVLSPEETAQKHTRGYQYQLLILENLQQLVQQFQDKIAVDEHKERLFDQLHQELQQHKNGMLDALTRSMELDVIQLIDSVRRTLEAWKDKVREEDGRKLYGLLEGVETDLCDLLYRHGVEPYTVPDSHVDVSRQKVVATVPTQEREKERTVAQRLASGWEKDGRVVRPERVSVYLRAGEDA